MFDANGTDSVARELLTTSFESLEEEVSSSTGMEVIAELLSLALPSKALKIFCVPSTVTMVATGKSNNLCVRGSE
ncbi:hypothetical protein GCM10007160_30990 [Litchfieldella qijiaojingensis]|uniref:Uncharacterized protein n=1 Tax=Litchfieldella qijiaojingensis TaxID=980347 RepID=A0ABQ2Z493_9GAMM|nr:hypothetical protein [Halomonas qijiaojingensis]GGY00955.1 hypothetical protein GCM10007160_30990 [Halomonas qijiaojingensis]